MDRVLVLNGEDYLVCNELTMNNKNYIFAVSVDNNRFTVLEKRTTENGFVVESLKDPEEVKAVITEISKENN